MSTAQRRDGGLLCFYDVIFDIFLIFNHSLSTSMQQPGPPEREAPDRTLEILVELALAQDNSSRPTTPDEHRPVAHPTAHYAAHPTAHHAAHYAAHPTAHPTAHYAAHPTAHPTAHYAAHPSTAHYAAHQVTHRVAHPTAHTAVNPVSMVRAYG